MVTSLHEAAPGGSPPWPLLGLSMASAATRSVETAVAVVAVPPRGSSGVDSNVIDVDKEQKQEKKEEKQQ